MRSRPTPSLPILILRVAVAVLLGIHGYYRAFSGGVSPFGAYLQGENIPFATATAWAVTVFEMVGSLFLLFGQLVRWVIPGFVLILITGILMLHGANGWFVVGGGRNGVEYSVLLIVCLVVLFASHTRNYDSPGRDGLSRGLQF